MSKIEQEHIADYITNLLEFSKTVPFSQIPGYILQKRQEKENLEEQIQILEEKGIPVGDISKLAGIVNQLSQLFSYDASKVTDALSNLESLKAEHSKYQAWIKEVKTAYYSLNQERSRLQNEVASFNQSLSVYNQLDDMNFGLKELKLMWNTILEIAAANNIPREQAVSKFIKDIEQQYDDKLGFESKIDNLHIKVNKLGQQELKLIGEINAIPRLGIGVLKLLDLHHNDSKSNSSIEELDLLIDQVRKCGGINAAISKLRLPSQDDKEGHKGEISKQEGGALLVDQANKSSSNETIEKEEQSLTVSETQVNHDDDPQFRPMINEAIQQIPRPPDPPSMRAFYASSSNNSGTIEYTKLLTFQYYINQMLYVCLYSNFTIHVS